MVDFADFEGSYSRRSMLGQLLSGLTLGRTHAEPLEPLISYVEGGALGLPGGFLALELYPPDHWTSTGEEMPEGLNLFPGYGWLGIRVAHRSEAIPPEAGPDPEPITVEYTKGTSVLRPSVIRTWKADEIGTCRRCERCRATCFAGSPEVALCILRHDGPIPETHSAIELLPKPSPTPSISLAERKFQRRLAAINRRTAIRKSRKRRQALDLALEGCAASGA